VKHPVYVFRDLYFIACQAHYVAALNIIIIIIIIIIIFFFFLLLLLLLLLLRKQGLKHTPQMHRSLEAYCATLGPPQFRRSRFYYGREMSGNFV